jgi:hypothetical protein
MPRGNIKENVKNENIREGEEYNVKSLKILRGLDFQDDGK